MKKNNKIGSKERLFEIFNKVNKLGKHVINESTSPVLNNDFINVLIDDADLGYMKSENPDGISFDVMDAIYIFRHDYNEDNPFINWLGTLPTKYEYRPSPLLNSYENLSDDAKQIYNTLQQGEDFYTDNFIDGNYGDLLR